MIPEDSVEQKMMLYIHCLNKSTNSYNTDLFSESRYLIGKRYKIFRIELRCEWVNTKNMELFHGMLLHSSVATETCFGQLGLYLEIRDS